MSRLLGARKVLCLAVHPDDVAYAATGAILTHPETHFDILSMTIGSAGDETATSRRRQEQKVFWEGVGNSTVRVSLWQYFSDASVEAWLNWIGHGMKAYDFILCPSQDDSHYEHRAASGLCSALTRALPIGIVEFRTPSTLVTWSPNYFVGLSEQTYAAKKLRLQTFNSQQNRSYFNSELLRLFHSNYQCLKRGLACVEEFRIVQLYGGWNDG